MTGITTHAAPNTENPNETQSYEQLLRGKVMGQVNKEFAESIINTSELGKHAPLTVWEQKQLALAWLRFNYGARHGFPERCRASTTATVPEAWIYQGVMGEDPYTLIDNAMRRSSAAPLPPEGT
jgi:hypothetical protein